MYITQHNVRPCYRVILIIALAMSINLTLARARDAFLEATERVRRQAETALEASANVYKTACSSHDWSSVTGVSNSALQCTSDNGGSWTNTGTLTLNTVGSALVCKVKFVMTSTYKVWLLAGGVNADYESDSLHVGRDDAYAFTQYSLNSANIAWMNTGTISVSSTGYHDDNIWCREDGARVDKIYLTTGPDTPSGGGPAESSREVAPPEAPASLSATAISSNQIDVCWMDNSSDETGFEVGRALDSGFTTGLTVNAYTTGVNPPMPVPATGLVASATFSNRINFLWTDNASNETGCKTHRITNAGGTYSQIDTVGSNVTSYNNTGLAASTTCSHQVRAYNGSDDSAFSNEANAATTTGGATRTAWLWPFSSNSPFNRPIADEATYTDDANIRSGGATINYTAYTPRVVKATSSSPMVLVTNGTAGTPANCYGINGGLPTTVRIPAGETGPPPMTCGRDGTLCTIDADGETSHVFYNFIRNTDTTARCALHRSSANSNVVTGEGWNKPGGGEQPGTSASGMSDLSGLIRSWELLRTDVPGKERIRHTLACGHMSSALRNAATQAGTFKWPATNSDGHWQQYGGTLYIGELLAIPKSVDINSLGLNADGLALAWTLQNYGIYVRDESRGGMTLHAEIGVDPTMIENMKSNLAALRSQLRKVNTNTQATPGGGTSWPASLYPAPTPVP